MNIKIVDLSGHYFSENPFIFISESENCFSECVESVTPLILAEVIYNQIL